MSKSRKLSHIATSELLSDLRETIEDIEYCRLADPDIIIAGIRVGDRLAGNIKIEAVIEKELARRRKP